MAGGNPAVLHQLRAGRRHRRWEWESEPEGGDSGGLQRYGSGVYGEHLLWLHLLYGSGAVGLAGMRVRGWEETNVAVGSSLLSYCIYLTLINVHI